MMRIGKLAIASALAWTGMSLFNSNGEEYFSTDFGAMPDALKVIGGLVALQLSRFIPDSLLRVNEVSPANLKRTAARAVNWVTPVATIAVPTFIANQFAGDVAPSQTMTTVMTALGVGVLGLYGAKRHMKANGWEAAAGSTSGNGTPRVEAKAARGVHKALASFLKDSGYQPSDSDQGITVMYRDRRGDRREVSVRA
jgi:hypothetical protein